MRISIRKELRRRNRRQPQLLDQKPTQLEIPRPVRHVLREIIIFRQFDLREIGEHEVPALGVGIRHAQLVEHGAEAFHFGLHVALGFVPEVVAVGLLECDGRGFL